MVKYVTAVADLNFLRRIHISMGNIYLNGVGIYYSIRKA